MLKGRFLSLKEMGAHKDIQEIYKAIEAMMILHNICIFWRDNPERIWEYNPNDPWPEVKAEIDNDMEEEDGDVPRHETEQWLRETGHLKRRILLDALFPA